MVLYRLHTSEETAQTLTGEDMNTWPRHKFDKFKPYQVIETHGNENQEQCLEEKLNSDQSKQQFLNESLVNLESDMKITKREFSVLDDVSECDVQSTNDAEVNQPCFSVDLSLASDDNAIRSDYSSLRNDDPFMSQESLIYPTKKSPTIASLYSSSVNDESTWLSCSKELELPNSICNTDPMSFGSNSEMCTSVNYRLPEKECSSTRSYSPRESTSSIVDTTYQSIVDSSLSRKSTSSIVDTSYQSIGDSSLSKESTSSMVDTSFQSIVDSSFNSTPVFNSINSSATEINTSDVDNSNSINNTPIADGHAMKNVSFTNPSLCSEDVSNIGGTTSGRFVLKSVQFPNVDHTIIPSHHDHLPNLGMSEEPAYLERLKGDTTANTAPVEILNQNVTSELERPNGSTHSNAAHLEVSNENPISSSQTATNQTGNVSPSNFLSGAFPDDVPSTGSSSSSIEALPGMLINIDR